MSQEPGPDLDALTALGQRLLTGDGVVASPREGVACLNRAADRGHAGATAQLALIAAFGVLRPRSLSD
ncbi:MAG: SEL1-like repeat protein, partial [Steroidobacteraceae bacterium]|nr:SEL1-like repeat protein [Steroidobacteraceae bacterium]